MLNLLRVAVNNEIFLLTKLLFMLLVHERKMNKNDIVLENFDRISRASAQSSAVLSPDFLRLVSIVSFLVARRYRAKSRSTFFVISSVAI